MLQFVFEIIVAVLAVYGGYTALHELARLIEKWLDAPSYSREDANTVVSVRKEDSHARGDNTGSHHSGGDG